MLFSYFLFHLKIWKQTFHKFLVYLSEYRLVAKTTMTEFIKNIVNYQIAIYFVPFFFGLTEMVWLRYKDQSFSYFLKNQLPGIYVAEQLVSFETFENIKIDHLKQNLSQIERIDFYPDSILIQLNSSSEIEQKQLSFGIFSRKEKLENTKNLKDSVFLQKVPKFGNSIWYQLPSRNIVPILIEIEKGKGKELNKVFQTKNKILLPSSNGMRLVDGKTKKKLQTEFFKTKQTFLNFHSNINVNSRKQFFYQLDELPTKLNNSWFTLSGKRLPFKGTQFPFINKKNLSSAKETFAANGLQKKLVLEKNRFYKTPVFGEVEFSKGKVFLQNLFLKTPSKGGAAKCNFAAPIINGKKPVFKKINNRNNFFSPLKGTEKNLFQIQKIKNPNNFQKDFIGIYSTQFKGFEDRLDFNDSNSSETPFFQETNSSSPAKRSFPDKGNDNLQLNSFLKKFDNLKHKKDFFEKSEILEIELKKQIYENGIIPFSLKTENDFFPDLADFLKLQKNFINFPFDFSFSEIDSEQLLFLINDFTTGNVNNLIEPRIMSGYQYPDMNRKQVESFLHQSFYQFKKFSNAINSIKIQLPPSFVPTFKYPFSEFLDLMVPDFKLISKQISLQNLTKSGVYEKIYEGPSILFDEITKDLIFKTSSSERANLSSAKKTDVSFSKEKNQPFEIENWLRESLFGNNPRTDRKEIFFGQTTPFLRKKLVNGFVDNISQGNNFQKQIFQQHKDFSPFISKNSSFSLEKLLYYVREVNKNFVVIPSNVELHIPYLDEKEWKEISDKLIRMVNKTSQDAIDDQFELPVIRIRYPKSEVIDWPFDQIDYTVCPPENFEFVSVFFGTKKQSSTFQTVSHYVPWAQGISTDILTETKQIGEIYKKSVKIVDHFSPSFFSGKNQKRWAAKQSFAEAEKKDHLLEKTKNVLLPFLRNEDSYFFEIWEPITSNSWLVLTKIAYYYLVLGIFQILFEKLKKEIVSSGFLNDEMKKNLGLEDRPTSFRIIKKIEKQFKDMAGIDPILPELGEIVLFLRSAKLLFAKGGSSKVSKIVPKGILLVGPPGNGKTLLVQAIAGEAEVPVILQSCTALNDPKRKADETVRNGFERARKLAPCILFFDEIDTLGQRRENVIESSIINDQIIESIGGESTFGPEKTSRFLPFKNSNLNEQDSPPIKKDYNPHIDTDENLKVNIASKLVKQKKKKRVAQKHLTEFLIEMDGLKSRQGVIVIGATNRPGVLDPAFKRPGRFDRIFHLDLPQKRKRIEILKLYSKNLGIQSDVSWDYLSNRTAGFSAADLSTIMNQSAMKAILQETKHTVETIEHGIDVITSYSTKKPKQKIFDKTSSISGKEKQEKGLQIESLQKNQTIDLFKGIQKIDPFFVTRFAYYGGAKAIVHSLLLEYPPVIHLWPRPKNGIRRMEEKTSKFQTNVKSRSELENRLIGFYAGKAGEFLALHQNYNFFSTKNKKFYFWESNLGIEELSFASSLAHSMIDRWYFYSKKIATRKFHQLVTNRNFKEIPEPLSHSVFKEIAFRMERESSVEDPFLKSPKIFQKWSIRPWWQIQVIKEATNLDELSSNWYRIYMNDPQQIERNREWVPPDEYYHNNNNLKGLPYLSLKNRESYINSLNKGVTPRKGGLQFEELLAKGFSKINPSITFNDLYQIDHDYIYFGLILNSFHQAFSILDENRELLDYFADYLMRHETIRQDEISNIMDIFAAKRSFAALEDAKISRENSKNPQKASETIFDETEKISVKHKNWLLTKSELSEENTDLSKKSSIIVEKAWGNNSRRKNFRFIDVFEIQSWYEAKKISYLLHLSIYRSQHLAETVMRDKIKEFEFLLYLSIYRSHHLGELVARHKVKEFLFFVTISIYLPQHLAEIVVREKIKQF